jgi:oligosaccharide 4-alpha-D-glucosyltransferase
MGLFGLAYTHSDLGGFAGGEVFDPELYTRWMQFGTFTPVFRPHAQEHIAPEPVFHPDPVKSIARDFIKLRYQLIPYIYSLAYQNSLTGMPLMRPLFMAFEDAALEETQSYMFGDAFWVSPITDPGVTSISATLPPGTWFNFWTKQKVAGSASVQIDAPLEQLPVMVRAGSFVPMVDSQQTLSSYSTETLSVHYYADKSVTESQYSMFDDDGISADSLTPGQHEHMRFTAQFDDALVLSLGSEGDFAGRPQQREIEWVVHGLENPPARVLIDDNPYTLDSDIVVWNADQGSLSVSTQAQRQLRLKLEW